MLFTTVFQMISILVELLLLGVTGYLVWLLIRALRKYLRSGPVRKEQAQERVSLAHALKEHRLRCQMTQEFVAERLGVSRQAVSKWETGAADPSTTNLLALARLYGVSPEELLRAAAGEGEPPPETS